MGHKTTATDNGAEITNEHDLLPPGAAPGTMPTDLEQSTGLERLEILGKMQGVDIFDMRPLDASRKGAYNLSQSIFPTTRPFAERKSALHRQPICPPHLLRVTKNRIQTDN